MAQHHWALSWPGNYCVVCRAGDPAEECMADCKECPNDEDGYPNPFKCPVHGNPELWECRPRKSDDLPNPGQG